MLFTPLITIAVAGVAPKDAGLGSGVVNVFQQVAAAIGVAVLGTISEDQTRTQLAAGHTVKDSLWSGYNLAFIVAASSVALALLLSTVLLRKDRSGLSSGGVIEHSGIAGDVVDELPLSVPAGADQ
jgi:hypothetical protein